MYLYSILTTHSAWSSLLQILCSFHPSPVTPHLLWWLLPPRHYYRSQSTLLITILIISRTYNIIRQYNCEGGVTASHQRPNRRPAALCALIAGWLVRYSVAAAAAAISLRDNSTWIGVRPCVDNKWQ